MGPEPRARHIHIAIRCAAPVPGQSKHADGPGAAESSYRACRAEHAAGDEQPACHGTGTREQTKQRGGQRAAPLFSSRCSTGGARRE